jgi:ABC-2 type transport system permease protein
MLILVKTEFLKLRTVRGPWLLLAIAPLVVLAGVSGLVISGNKTLNADAQSDALAHVGLTSIITLIFGILAVSGEYRHRTIADSYLTDPRRAATIVAKLLAYSAIAAVSAVISSIVGVLAAAAWWAGKGSSLVWSASGMWDTITGSIIWSVAFAAVGVGLGALIRNLAAAIAAALAWIALVEGVVAQLLGDSLGKWLPFNAGRALGASASDSSSDLLSRSAGALVLIVYVLGCTVAALAVTRRRDVG